ncbi:MAG TPA: hypothetical protein VMA09_02055 [Candidatus Binataceae bacterium]|nr:hypothetical protein [Candidatus Binataceae bacterium]
MAANEIPRDLDDSVASGDLTTNVERCDACNAPMKPMGHCKYWCLRCGFLRTCNDVI